MPFTFMPINQVFQMPLRAKDVVEAMKQALDMSKMDNQELAELRAEVWAWNEQLEAAMNERSAKDQTNTKTENEEDTDQFPIWCP